VLVWYDPTMRLLALVVSAFLFSCGSERSPAPSSPAAARDTLDIYFVDVEGGQATLLVTPEGESMLVDSGFPGFGGRDAGRIRAAADRAGITRIDYHVITHYHRDHVGGTPEVAALIPIRGYVDHGPTVETSESAKQLYDAYVEVRSKGAHLEVKPGDRIPLEGAEVTVVTAAKQVLSQPLPGAGAPNPACADTPRMADDPSENAHSTGFHLTFGKFRFVNLGDLTWNTEIDLMCPENRLGEVDLYLTSHHGLDSSGSPALVHGLKPRVAIMNNGATKGGTPQAWEIVSKSPGLEDFWQLHRAVKSGDSHNVAADRIANLDDAEGHEGHWIKVSARRDGSFTVHNSRNGFEKTYAAR
jgi:competence protein ComEC